MGKRRATVRVTVEVKTPLAAVQAVEVVQVGIRREHMGHEDEIQTRYFGPSPWFYHVLGTFFYLVISQARGGDTLEPRQEARSSSTLQSGTKPAVGDSSSSGTTEQTTAHSADPSRLLDGSP